MAVTIEVLSERAARGWSLPRFELERECVESVIDSAAHAGPLPLPCPESGRCTLVDVPIAKSQGADVHSADHQQLAVTKIHADRNIFLNRHG